MNATKIEWVQNPNGTPGFTWNPITGCLNHVNGLCKGGGFPCYAYRLANGRLRGVYLGNSNVAGYDADKLSGRQKIDMLEDPFYPRFWPERLEEPLVKVSRWGRGRMIVHRRPPKGIFVCDMGELFGDWIPEEWTRDILRIIEQCPSQDRFYLLTKQPQNLAKFSPFPDNCWVGATATNQQAYLDAVYSLVHVKAHTRYISFEPLLSEIPMVPEQLRASCDWVIISAQTKPYKPPKIEWVREIVGAADKVGIPIFLKDNLKPLIPPEVPTFYTLLEPWNDIDPKPTLRQDTPNAMNKMEERK